VNEVSTKVTRAVALQLTIALQRDQEVGPTTDPTTHIGGLISGEHYTRSFSRLNLFILGRKKRGKALFIGTDIFPRP
jgi:hypothetical protein